MLHAVRLELEKVAVLTHSRGTLMNSRWFLLRTKLLETGKLELDLWLLCPGCHSL